MTGKARALGLFEHDWSIPSRPPTADRTQTCYDQKSPQNHNFFIFIFEQLSVRIFKIGVRGFLDIKQAFQMLPTACRSENDKSFKIMREYLPASLQLIDRGAKTNMP
jgi:hypothetical protein